jgi:flavin reductase (DIM6/NTAB) family NADH-FMN oxidoreductase RutF
MDPVTLRRVMSHFATGVAVVGTSHVGGGVCGLTVNAFASLSLSPPLALVCLDRGSNTYGCIRASGLFAASFLAEDQHELSVRFAEKRDDKFDAVPFRLAENGAPIVEGAIGWVECELDRDYPGGDHDIFLARVVRGGWEDQGSPLVFFRGGYTTVASPVRDEEAPVR